MARITVEDCLEMVPNRFALVILAVKRAKQILTGSKVLSSEARGNKSIVSALREIAEGKSRFMTPEEESNALESEAKEAAAIRAAGSSRTGIQSGMPSGQTSGGVTGGMSGGIVQPVGADSIFRTDLLETAPLEPAVTTEAPTISPTTKPENN